MSNSKTSYVRDAAPEDIGLSRNVAFQSGRLISNLRYVSRIRAKFMPPDRQWRKYNPENNSATPEGNCRPYVIDYHSLTSTLHIPAIELL